MSRLPSLWRNLLRRDRVERDLDDEMRATLDILAEEKQRTGMDRREARRAAAIELGGIESIKEQVRQARAGFLVETLAQDVRYAVRLLRRQPLFTLTAALSLAIAIGANTTIFSLANALLLRTPTGVADPDSLVDIGGRVGAPDFVAAFNPVSYEDYLLIGERATSFDGVYAHRLFPPSFGLTTPNGAERIVGDVVTPNFFEVLGARAVAGRLFSAADAPASLERQVVVLSHRFWTRRFGHDTSIVGQILRINGYPFTVVGIASEGFQGTGVFAVDAWIPNDPAPGGERDGARPGPPNVGLGSVVLGARLKEGVSPDQAAQELEILAQAVARDSGNSNVRRFRLLPSSPLAGNRGPIEIFVGFLMAIVGTVLAIACANLAGLLLARAASRRQEFGIRVAIGAGGVRLVRQLLTETLLLFILGGAAGLLLARGMTSVLLSFLPVLPIPVSVSLDLDARVMAFTAGLSLVAAVVCGLAPALQTSRADVVSALKNDASSRFGRQRLRQAFVVAQIALSLLLVIVGGLFTRALQQIDSANVGFERRGVDLVSLNLSLAGYNDSTGPRFTNELLQRLRTMPGAEAIALATQLPMAAEGRVTGVSVPGVQAPNGEPFFGTGLNFVSAAYFATVGIPVIAGRDFAAGERAGAPAVAVVGEATARRFWPGKDPLGQPLTLAFQEPPVTVTVIGVARDVAYRGFAGSGAAELFVYLPLQQHYQSQITIVSRPPSGQSSRANIVRLIASMDRNLPVINARALEDDIALSLAPQRIASSIAGVFGMVGLLLAGVGIYGVTAYNVARRGREIAVRLALGASRTEVIRMVLRQGALLAAVGSAIGMSLGAIANAGLTALLFGVSAFDVATFGAAAAVFSSVALAASFVPVRRAVRIDAAAALRCE